jgi:uncharacterized membrane protein YfcA
MATAIALVLAIPFFLAALLYSSVGHAGASAYLAVMALFGMTSSVMKPTALILNIVVATIATVKFHRAGLSSWPLFWPFAVTAIPFAFLGGAITLPAGAYETVVGFVLIFAAVRLLIALSGPPVSSTTRPKLWVALVVGAGIGLLSGLVGVGGGIFLSPLILLAGWADPRTTSAVAAPFILVNSVAGILGNPSSIAAVPPQLPIWAAAVVAGGWIGAHFGSQRLKTVTIRRLLALVLIIAGVKMILT